MKKYHLNDFLNAKKFPNYMFVSDFIFDFSQITSIKELACGGIGCVYKVEFAGFPAVCIKLQSKNSSFKQFASVYSSNRVILDEYVVQIYEIGSILIGNSSLNYTIMEYLPYQSLNKQQLNNKEITSLFTFLLQFMNRLHSNNMSYSDVKPANIVYISGNHFKVIDIDTLMPLIPESQEEAVYNTTTDYYNITDTVLFSSHPLSQLASCVYTCLECMHIYPKCNKKNPIYQYENYLLNLAKYYNITNANQIPMIFNTIYEYLLEVTHNELYTLLSMFVMYILLIPKYTIAYIDSSYWYNMFSWYYEYIPETCESTVELCNDNNLKENMKTILAIGAEPWTADTDPAIEASKIPSFINISVFKETLPTYIDMYNKKIKNLPNMIKNKYKMYTIEQDNYSLLRQDPRTTLKTPLYKRI